MSQTKLLIPTLDDAPGADHALEGLAARIGRVELAAVFQPAAVLGGDQGALDRGLAIAYLQVFNAQFITHFACPVGCRGLRFRKKRGALQQPCAS